MMDTNKTVYTTQIQKRKLIRLITQNPQLVHFKASQDFNFKDSQRLWKSITNQCNALPGARKTWKQWRKTFQDIRAKAKIRQKEMNGEIPASARFFTPLEQEVMGYTLGKGSQDLSESQEHDLYTSKQEQMMLETNHIEEINLVELQTDETKSPSKVTPKQRIIQKMSNASRSRNKNNSNSYNDPSYDLLATLEQEKIKIKADYLSFKKDYLSEKLKLMKEQTEALQSIARELAK
ncbi:uncharacterized protein LOC105385747 isoform X1 [Plutella xylostella]|uniref:uncharacterized protein LOC105385747 isoform X1 n=1 Tax=Plutella xylostella TaxID=51655 RepID=UPI002032A3F9|nr:uncharacterized protein LOC105385747 isoform X1 [Plutella xylostella]